jgi:hypothetical protein
MENVPDRPHQTKDALQPALWKRPRFLLLLLLLALLVIPPYAYRRRLKVENAAAIEIGMSRADVEALLGGPPGMYGLHGGFAPTFQSLGTSGAPAAKYAWFWTGEEVSIGVWFSANEVCEAPTTTPMPATLVGRTLYWTLYPLAFWSRDVWL